MLEMYVSGSLSPMWVASRLDSERSKCALFLQGTNLKHNSVDLRHFVEEYIKGITEQAQLLANEVSTVFNYKSEDCCPYYTIKDQLWNCRHKQRLDTHFYIVESGELATKKKINFVLFFCRGHVSPFLMLNIILRLMAHEPRVSIFDI